MFNALQKATAQAIVNVFETGTPQGRYDLVTLLKGDSGQLTYGRSQTTLASGNLHILIAQYVGARGSFGPALQPYLPALQARDRRLNNDANLKTLLRRAAREDPRMRQVQDSFFDRVYWQPAVESAQYLGVQTALGMAIVYDSRVHGSFHKIRDRTTQRYGPLPRAGEAAWMRAYVATRRAWLASFRGILAKTVYRMDTFNRVIQSNRWGLQLPLDIRGHTITAQSIGFSPAPALFSWLWRPSTTARLADDGTDIDDTGPGATGQELAPPYYYLADPPMADDLVIEIQNALLAQGATGLTPDGLFGPRTHFATVAFQRRVGQPADGIVGPETLQALGLTTPTPAPVT